MTKHDPRPTLFEAVANIEASVRRYNDSKPSLETVIARICRSSHKRA